tara:strand:+ start:46 stop:582 length:537 start_codon:yes stop_codon:yes gene_type:complete
MDSNNFDPSVFGFKFRNDEHLPIDINIFNEENIDLQKRTPKIYFQDNDTVYAIKAFPYGISNSEQFVTPQELQKAKDEFLDEAKILEPTYTFQNIRNKRAKEQMDTLYKLYENEPSVLAYEPFYNQLLNEPIISPKKDSNEPLSKKKRAGKKKTTNKKKTNKRKTKKKILSLKTKKRT